MKKAVRTLNQKGQSSVEYLLIVAVLVLAIFTFGTQLKSGLAKITDDVFKSVGTSLQNKIGEAQN